MTIEDSVFVVDGIYRYNKRLFVAKMFFIPLRFLFTMKVRDHSFLFKTKGGYVKVPFGAVVHPIKNENGGYTFEVFEFDEHYKMIRGGVFEKNKVLVQFSKPGKIPDFVPEEERGIFKYEESCGEYYVSNRSDFFVGADYGSAWIKYGPKDYDVINEFSLPEYREALIVEGEFTGKSLYEVFSRI